MSVAKYQGPFWPEEVRGLQNERDSTIDSDTRRRVTKRLLRERRKFLRQSKSKRFIENARTLQRDDKFVKSKTTAIQSEGREKVLAETPGTWGSALVDHYSSFYSDTVNTTDKAISLLATLAAYVAADHMEGGKIIELDWEYWKDMITKLPLHKSAEIDGISYEALRFLSNEDKETLRAVLQDYANSVGDDQPRFWDTVIVKCLPKEKNATSLSDFRQICLIPVVANVYMKALINFARALLNPLYTNTLGSQPGKQCLDMIQPTSHTIQRAADWGDHVVSVQLDVSKAFDHIEHEKLVEALQDAKLPPGLIYAISGSGPQRS